MFRVYSKEKVSKELFTVNLLQEEVETVLEGNLFLDHPELKEEDCVVIEMDNEVQNPTWDGNELREMTREEKILLLEETDLLVNGEYLENGEIKEVKYIKELGYYRPTWNKELHIWEEGTTREEFIEMRRNKILEYSKLEEEKRIFENIKFPSEDEVEVIIEKMAILEADINNLQEKIKLL
ncbi:hypothetical protein [Fusobacterium sp.]|uniref:hypothetical protein n=1 Tax=Fusobacterium sp. TaxID=68766 RepID=UPI000E963BC1|nr:hypothetical protein [Fusobacterium sp.]HBJ77937.1 hypothetical protein [Fusobacterium sp.]